jgi:hypothetical protein
MEFDNSFTVNAPLQRVWDFLLNVQEVAPCMPGAELTEVVSDTEYKGTVKIKLGAVQMSYKGTATISQIDEATHTVVLVASGRETRGTGNASSTTTSRLEEEAPDRTVVHLTSQVDVSGRVAQFGRGIMQDVASRLIGEFARNLEAKMMSQEDSLTAATASADEDSGAAKMEAEGGPPGVGESTSTTPQRAPMQAPRYAPVPASEPQPIRVLPIITSVARSQVARGLRRLARLVEPSDQ